MNISDVFDEPLMSAARVGLGAIHIDFGFCLRSSISNQWLVRGDQSLLQGRQQLEVEQRVVHWPRAAGHGHQAIARVLARVPGERRRSSIECRGPM